MRWFRNIIYYLTDKPLWGIRQLIADTKNTHWYNVKDKPGKDFDPEQFKSAIDKFLQSNTNK